MPQLFLAWKYLPGNITLITGFFNGSFGIGAFTFTLLACKLINPHDESPQIITPDGDKLYPKSIADNVPTMFRTVCYAWSALLFFSILLLPGYVKENKPP